MRFYNKKGVSFIEVMLTIAIFSFGILVIFKAFIVSLDRMSYLTDRLYASIILDNRISVIQRKFKIYDALPFAVGQIDDFDMGNKRVSFKQGMEIGGVEDFPDIFKIDLSIAWIEKGRNISLNQSAYITNIQN